MFQTASAPSGQSIAQPATEQTLQPRAFRGILVALILSIPIWTLLIWAIIHVI
jgi:hypothetical protein